MSSRLTHRRSRKTGLPPGSLVHVGEARGEAVHVEVFRYDEAGFESKRVTDPAEILPLPDDKITWIDIDGLHDVALIEKFGKAFGLHSLLLEDVLNANQRPKVDEYDDVLFLVFRMLRYDEKRHVVRDEQVSLVVGKNYVLSFQEGPGDVLDPIRDRIRTGKGRVRRMKADYLAYAILDAVVDHYFVILEKFGDEIENLEHAVTLASDPRDLKLLHHLKREMIFLRKAVWPLREVLSGFVRGQYAGISDAVEMFFHDLYDHTIQIVDTIESYRDLLSGILDVYMSGTSNRMNAIMKVLTVISTIFMPLTFIVGIYGMNFDYMPELRWHWGYPAVMVLMLGIALGMFGFFRGKKWID